GAPLPFGRTMIYLRTQAGGPLYRDFEKSLIPSSGNSDSGKLGTRSQHNDTLDKIFPLGAKGFAGEQDSNFEWFTRDLLYNFAFRDSSFDPHTLGGLPPPDVDLYYFVGGEGDQIILDVETADQGATFDSQLELFSIPLSVSALDPTSTESLLAVADADLTLLALIDDQSPTDLDPHLEMTLPVTGLFVVRVSASPAQTVFPGITTPYSIYHQSLRPDEFSIPIIARGSFFATGAASLDRVTGLSLHLEFDPAVVRMTGVDLAQGTRNFLNGLDQNPATAQEYVAEQVPGTPGLVRFAVRSYRDNVFQRANGLKNDGLLGGSCNPCRELVIARLRFRVVGPGDTTIEISDNPTAAGEKLLNLGLGEFSDGPIWQPFFGYGPGVQISVTATP
ncbi:MAG: pre-peptidase C-terminal domain-containing protein, partial [Acidobacteria bacterium]|nr:pre-peptidase C-terminal domain-containing protein [Acidobacteriota bacterium]